MKAPGPAKGTLVQPFCKSTCKLRAKRTFQAQTDLNSSIFSIGIILTLKPKQDFCVKSKSWSYEDGGYFFFISVRMCVVQWIQSSLEGKKNVICCRLFTASKKIPCLNRAAKANKSDQKSVHHHARAVRAE